MTSINTDSSVKVTPSDDITTLEFDITIPECNPKSGVVIKLDGELPNLEGLKEIIKNGISSHTTSYLAETFSQSTNAENKILPITIIDLRKLDVDVGSINSLFEAILDAQTSIDKSFTCHIVGANKEGIEERLSNRFSFVGLKNEPIDNTENLAKTFFSHKLKKASFVIT